MLKVRYLSTHRGASRVEGHKSINTLSLGEGTLIFLGEIVGDMFKGWFVVCLERGRLKIAESVCLRKSLAGVRADTSAFNEVALVGDENSRNTVGAPISLDDHLQPLATRLEGGLICDVVHNDHVVCVVIVGIIGLNLVENGLPSAVKEVEFDDGVGVRYFDLFHAKIDPRGHDILLGKGRATAVEHGYECALADMGVANDDDLAA